MNRFLNILNEETKNLTKAEQKEVLNRLFEIYPNLKRNNDNEHALSYKNRPQRPTRG
nr:MAG TPA: hypothetical protein [Caudoviricetes sp.]